MRTNKRRQVVVGALAILITGALGAVVAQTAQPKRQEWPATATELEAISGMGRESDELTARMKNLQVRFGRVLDEFRARAHVVLKATERVNFDQQGGVFFVEEVAPVATAASAPVTSSAAEATDHK